MGLEHFLCHKDVYQSAQKYSKSWIVCSILLRILPSAFWILVIKVELLCGLPRLPTSASFIYAFPFSNTQDELSFNDGADFNLNFYSKINFIFLCDSKSFPLIPSTYWPMGIL